MSKSKSNSTTMRLRDLQVRRIRSAMGFTVLFAVLLLIYGFCYVNDSAYLDDSNIFTFWTECDRGLHFERAEGDIFPEVKYVMLTEGMAEKSVNATEIFYFTLLAIIVLGIINAFVAMIYVIFAKAEIQNRLDPLYRMARKALELSDESNMQKSVYSDEKIHDLESAIDSISPEKPNAVLKTGDVDLKGLEEAINSLLQRTRDSYSQQIRFVSDASHELRTPIAVVKGYTDMLDRWGKQDEKVLDESILAIKTETEHMNTLVEQLLFLARGDSGQTKFEMRKFSLSDMIREVYEESVMIDSDHIWEISIEDEVTVVGDQPLLKQAVRILVDNATKYSPVGETISIKAKYNEQNAPTVIVQDNGMGILGEDLPHIFERFYRSDPARGREQGGTGLGLAIAKQIANKHNARLDVLSREGLGTRISIHFTAQTI